MEKKQVPWAVVFAGLSMVVSLTGCELAKGIFKAGVWTGLIIVVFAVALFAGIASMIRRA